MSSDSIDPSSNPALAAEVAKAASAPIVMSRQATDQLSEQIEVVKETPKEKVETSNEAERKHDQSADQSADKNADLGDEAMRIGEKLEKPREEGKNREPFEDRGEKVDTLA